MSALGAETTRGEISIGNRRNSRRLWSRPGASGRSRTLVPHLVGPRGVSCDAPRIKAAKNIRSSDCRRRERNSAFCDAVHRSIDPSSLMQRLVSANRPKRARGIHEPLGLLSEPCLPHRFGHRWRIVTPSHVRRDRAHDPQFGRPLFCEPRERRLTKRSQTDWTCGRAMWPYRNRARGERAALQVTAIVVRSDFDRQMDIGRPGARGIRRRKAQLAKSAAPFA